MMLLNERAMAAMLNDVNQVDYDIPSDGKLLETQGLLANEAIVPSKENRNLEKENPIKGKDFSLLGPIPKDLENEFSSKIDSNFRRIAKKLRKIVSS